MNLLGTALVFLSGVSATRLLQLAQGTRAVNVVLQVDKVTSQAAIDVWNDDKTEVLAHSCSRSLTSGSFESTPLVFTVDEHGAGTLAVGSQTYAIHDEPGVSGGIVCGRVASADEVTISCDVPIPTSLQLKSLNKKRDLRDCFPQGSLELLGVVRSLESSSADDAAGINQLPPFTTLDETSHVAVDAVTAAAAAAPVSRRQGACGVWSSTTFRVGDGNPHQNPLHIQVSEPMECGHVDGCEIGYSSVRSYTIGWTANLAPVMWISGGFAVESSIETGTVHACPGNAYDYFAVWRKVGQTAYTVQNADFNVCTGTHPRGSPFVMWSPNANNRGGNFYCVYSRQYVRALGDRYIDTSPQWPGGP